MDIDSDFKTDDREKVLDYVKAKYGEHAICNIMTKGTLGAKNAIRSAARILGDAKYGDTRALLNLGDDISRVLPQKPDVKLSDFEEALNEFKSADAKQIISDAKLIEGVTIQYGIHAAGVILADSKDVSDYIPLMRTKEDEPLVCQCDMTEAEENAGLLKFDFLGLRNLNIITDTLRIIKRVHGKEIDIEEVGRSLKDGRITPFDLPGKNVFDEIFARGRTNSVFQFESGGMKSMLRRFKPSNMDDVILLVAAYRPGPMAFLDDIIDIKHGRNKPHYIVPEMEEILKATYGYPIYQEQLMQIFNKVAGFSLGESDQVRRAMSKKKTEKFMSYQGKFIEGLIKAGATPSDAKAYWESLMDFSKYAFNKSHAAAYAMVAFYTAWLKLNYPAEYMTAVLNHTSQDKLPLMVAECEAMGITVLPPDINRSAEDFTYADGKILFGLGSIKNVGKATQSIIAERKKEAFHSFKDFIKRGHQRKDVTESLIDAGALDKWCSNRTALKWAIEPLSKDWKQVIDKEAKLTHEKDEKKRAQIEKRLNAYQERFNQLVLPIDLPESTLDRLEKEKELVGMYITGHPLDNYEKPDNVYDISDVQNGDISIYGMIKDLRLAKRKQDGRDIAFFKVEDKTGDIDVACFTKAYAEYGKLIEGGAVVKITGLCKETDYSEEDEKSYMMYANVIKKMPRKLKRLVVSCKDLADYTENVAPVIESFKGEDFELVIHDKMLGEIRKNTVRVSERILSSGLDIKPFDGEH